MSEKNFYICLYFVFCKCFRKQRSSLLAPRLSVRGHWLRSWFRFWFLCTCTFMHVMYVHIDVHIKIRAKMPAPTCTIGLKLTNHTKSTKPNSFGKPTLLSKKQNPDSNALDGPRNKKKSY